MPPVRVQVNCSGGKHTILWKRGAVALLDHDEDAERALVALGGDAPRCLEIIDTWRSAFVDADDYPFLDAWSTGTRASASFTLQVATHARKLAMQRLQPGVARRAARVWLRGAIGAMPDELLDRYAFATIVHCARAGVPVRPPLDSVLESKLVAAVHESIREWHPTRGTLPLVTVSPTAGICFEPRPHPGRVEIGVGIEWLIEVLARGIAVVDGLLVLGVDDALEATAVYWERSRDGSTVPICGRAQLVRFRGAWRATWLGAP